MSNIELNPLLTERTRLLIMAALASSEDEVDFTSLLKALELTRGNLSVHVRKLEEGGLVTIKKEFVENKPRTTFRCTPKGRREVKRYLESIEKLLKGIS